MQETVNFLLIICRVRSSTFLRVLQKITAWVMFTVS